MKRFGFLLLVVVMAGSVALFGADKEPIRIGMIASITGDAAEMGIEFMESALVAVDLINSKGGINGYPLSVSIVDGQSDPAAFATKAHRLVENVRVVAGFGGCDISFATAAGEVFQASKTAFTDIAGTTPTIPLVGDYMFMTPIPDNDQGRAVAMYIKDVLGYKKITIFKDVASAYGTKLTEYIIHFLKEFTGDPNPVPLVVTYETYDEDFSPQLTRIKAQADKLGIEAIVLPTWPRDAPTIAVQARALGIDLPLIGTDGVDTITLTEVGGEDVEGMVYSTHYDPDMTGQPEIALEYAVEYRGRFGYDAGAFGTMAYDSLMLLVESIKAVIDEKGEAWWDSASLAEKRTATRDKVATLEFQWTSQAFSFTPEGWPRRALVWRVVENGERVFYDFQSYEDYTPEGVETLPFK
ncbi:ABC transporter substrate-binding protein [Candidatus Bipolaricaulota bacterium]|nr:ABC transporter substrate-binding protein [Candidatus Bipolaricaulota bacterium]